MGAAFAEQAWKCNKCEHRVTVWQMERNSCVTDHLLQVDNWQINPATSTLEEDSSVYKMNQGATYKKNMLNIEVCQNDHN